MATKTKPDRSESDKKHRQKKTNISVRFPKEDLDKLNALVDELGVDRSVLIRDAVLRFESRYRAEKKRIRAMYMERVENTRKRHRLAYPCPSCDEEIDMTAHSLEWGMCLDFLDEQGWICKGCKKKRRSGAKKGK